jgi:nanoRNase/pAp phosphatase (c-di-AMP/oligoRNAs hydrolase)
MAERLAALLSALVPGRPALVQTHDYPDIDAVASAWALAELLRLQGRDAACAYRGEMRSRSLRRLVAALGIGIGPAGDARGRPSVVVVDGSPANGNVTLADGELAAVIDHHRPSGETGAPYVDTRADIASCSTLICGYWEEAGVPIPGPIATALLAGIQSDTDFLSCRASGEDFAAYERLGREGDRELAAGIVRAALDLRELILVAEALAAAEVRHGLLFALVRGECAQEALAVLAEFALRAEELRAAVAVGPGDGGTRVSARSRSADLSAFALVRRALDGIGTGGGHEHAAGGTVSASGNPGTGALRDRFFAAAEAARTRLEY